MQFLRFSLDVGPVQTQVQMLLRSPPVPSFYLFKAWIHKDDIYAWDFKSIHIQLLC